MNVRYIASEVQHIFANANGLRNRARLVGHCVAARVPGLQAPLREDDLELVEFGRPYRIRARRNGTDVMVLMQVFHYGEYDASGIPWANLRRIIDAGAHIGASTLYFAARAPQAEIACIEPEASNRELLTLNVADRNGPLARIFDAALWVRDEPIAFGLGELSVSHKVSSQAKGGASVQGKRVPTILDDLGWDSVDLLKIDVEGAERDLFEDPELGTWLPRVGNLLVECHSHFGFGSSPEDLQRILTPHGFRVLVHDHEKGLIAAHNEQFEAATG